MKCCFVLLFCGAVILILMIIVIQQTSAPEEQLAMTLSHKYGSWFHHRDLNRNPVWTENAAICKEKIQWYHERQTTTSLHDWTFSTTWSCPAFSLNSYPKLRQRVTIDCLRGDKPNLFKSRTFSSNDVFSVKFGDACLGRFIDTCCKGNAPVPNVVHYVWYSNTDMTFFHFLSFMSVVRFVKPCLFVIHGDVLPKGKYWDYCVSNVPNIIHVRRRRPTRIFNHSLAFIEHSSDVMGIEALKEYGGIYLDYDQVVLRPLEPLRKFRYVQGHEKSNRSRYLGPQLIMAEKRAHFLDLWYDGYRTDYRELWSYNSMEIPAKLAAAHPELIHVEGFNFTRPIYREAKRLIFNGNYDWSTNYGMHMFARAFEGTINTDIIRRMNTTLGSVSRHILFGNKEICET